MVSLLAAGGAGSEVSGSARPAAAAAATVPAAAHAASTADTARAPCACARKIVLEVVRDQSHTRHA